MPTLNQSTGELESGAAAKPSGLRTAVNKALTVLGIIGATAVTDANGQQQVAIATAVPQQPGQGGPVAPGNGESTVEEIPTAAEVIQILRDGQGAIKKKFPNYNDAAFLRIVGEISLGTVKPITLTGLAEAFTEESEKRDAIIAFSKVVNAPKPAFGSKEDLVLKKAKAEADKEAERIAKLTPKLLKDFKEWIRSASKWTAINAGVDKIDTKAEIAEVAGKIIIKFPKNGKTLGLGEFMAEVPAGNYDLTVKITGGPLIFWHGNKRLELKNGETTPIELMKPGFKLGGYVTKMKPIIEIQEITLTPKKPDKGNIVSGS